MRILVQLLLYPLVVMGGLYLVIVLPADLVAGATGLSDRGTCHLGASDCESYWQGVLSVLGVGYLALFVTALLLVLLHSRETGSGHER